MKKILLLLSLLLIGNVAFAQKKKSTVTKSKAKAKVVEKPVLLAKDEANNLVVEYLNNKIYVYHTVSSPKDTLFTRKTETVLKADNFKMSPVKVKNKNLYLFTWEEAVDLKSELIKENGKINGSEIWDLEQKKNLVSNRQKTTNYEEIRYLSKHKDASETIAKKINEGKLFTILENGDITLSGKSGSDKYVYNETDNTYKVVVPAKATAKKPNTKPKGRK